MRLAARRFVSLFFWFSVVPFEAYGEIQDTAFREDCENLQLSEGYNECFGSKCRKVWVYTMGEDRLSYQPENGYITNLQQFELEFWARIELSQRISVIHSGSMFDDKYTKTLDYDPFLIRFEKKIYCKLPKNGTMQEYMFIGILPSLN